MGLFATSVGHGTAGQGTPAPTPPSAPAPAVCPGDAPPLAPQPPASEDGDAPPSSPCCGCADPLTLIRYTAPAEAIDLSQKVRGCQTTDVEPYG